MTQHTREMYPTREMNRYLASPFSNSHMLWPLSVLAGAVLLGATKVATGHNADDVAETVLLNILRGDVARCARLSYRQSFSAFPWSACS